MNAREFYELVKRMRRLQKDYFRTRDNEILAQAKRCEKHVDSIIERTEKILQQQNQ